MAPATLVNVCGPGRSGTTMLDLMLGTPAEAFSCGEAVAAFQPRRPEHAHLVCSCGEDPCPVWERLRAGPAEQFHRRVADTLGVERVIDSSKWFGWVRDANRWGADSGMRVVNLLIWKEPLELAFSWWKRGELPADEEAIWCYVQYHARLLDAGFPVVSVPYADLADDPAGVLASTCRAIGLPYEPGQDALLDHGAPQPVRQLEGSADAASERRDHPPHRAVPGVPRGDRHPGRPHSVRPGARRRHRQGAGLRAGLMYCTQIPRRVALHPAPQAHGFHNATDTPARTLATFTPAGRPRRTRGPSSQPGRSSGRFLARWPSSSPVDWPTSIM